MQPIQQPITGSEDHDDLHEPLHALTQFYAALNRRDLGAMSANWSQSRDIVMDNPLGGIKRGWDEIETVYAKLFASPGAFRFEFFDYTLHQGADFFYAVGRERGELELAGERLALAIRTTRIFRRFDGFWKQVHHHGSIDDPSMLERYQRAILGRT